MNASTPQLEVSRACRARRLADLILGYDVFVSYAWSDGRPFAAELTSRLRGRGWRVFLDDNEIAPGAQLASALGTSLRRSSALTVVASYGAMTSPHVASEIEAFGRTGRPVVPIFPERARDAGESALADALRQRVFLERRGEPPDDGLVRQLESSFRFVRRARIRVFAAAAVTAIFAVLALVALLQAEAARRRAFEVELQLAARQIEDVLSTSRQADALPAAMSSARAAMSRLGMVPQETRRALWLAYEGAREIEAYTVPSGTDPAMIAPSGQVVAMSPDATLIAMARGRRRIAWRIARGGGELLPSGRAFLVTEDGSATQVRMLDGKVAAGFTSAQPSDGLVDISADGSVVVRSPDRRRILIRVNGGIERTVAAPIASKLNALRLDGDGVLLTIVGEDGRTAWINPKNGRTRRLEAGGGLTDAVAVSDDARVVAMLVAQKIVLLTIDPEQNAVFNPRRPATQLQADTPPSGLAVSDTRRVAVTYDNSGAVMIFGPDGINQVPPLLGAESPSIFLSGDGLRLATADKTGRTVRVYDLGPRTVRTVAGAGMHGQMATAMTVCGDRLIWGGMEGALRVTQVTRGRDPASWTLRSPHLRLAAIACSGHGAVTADLDGRVFYWETLKQSARPILLQGDARFLATRGDLAVGVGADEISFWRPARSQHRLAALPLLRLGLSTGQGTAIQFLDGGDLLIGGDHPSSGGVATVERWSSPAEAGVATRRWRKELPDLLLIRTSAAVDGGQFVYVSGILDSLYRVDSSGRCCQSNANSSLHDALRPSWATGQLASACH